MSKNKIILYSYADPKCPSKPRGEDGGLSKFAFSYLHGPLEDLNSKMMEDNGWNWEPPDLFVASREPTEEDFILIDSKITTKVSTRVLEDAEIMWSLDGKENKKPQHGSSKVETLFAIECKFYDYSCVAFLTRTINKQWLYFGDGEKTHDTLNRTDYRGRVVLPFYEEHQKFEERIERAERRNKYREENDIPYWEEINLNDETPEESAWLHASASLDKQKWM